MLRRHQGKQPHHQVSHSLRTNPPHQGIVYDVTGNKAYQPGGAYSGRSPSPFFPPPNQPTNQPTPYTVFAGKDASRALGKTSTKPEDVSPDWQDLPDKEKSTLNDWVTFFSKRYNVVGRVEGATNFEEAA